MTKITIRENATGREAIHHTDYEWNEWQWTDGNFGCDCNRHLFFARAVGEDENEDPDCGDGRYTIVKVTTDEGVEIPFEDPF